jgi:hypothetical protein
MRALRQQRKLAYRPEADLLLCAQPFGKRTFQMPSAGSSSRKNKLGLIGAARRV